MLETKIYSVKDLVVRGAMNVSETTGLPLGSCNRICSNARSRLEELGIINRPFTSPMYQETERISLGSKGLDDLLGGRGVHVGAITEFFGESNSGKTQVCHMLSVMVQLDKIQGGLGGKALYIDTESTFTQERIRRIAEARGLDKNKTVSNIILAKPMSSLEQERNLEMAGSTIDQNKNIKLLIIDSVSGLYRAEYNGRAALPERQQKLYRHMLMLRRFSEIYRVAAVVTNQVNEVPDNFGARAFRHRPAGGNIMAHASTYRIELRQFVSHRIAGLIHSPYLPEKQVYFGISAEGVNDVPKPEPLR